MSSQAIDKLARLQHAALAAVLSGIVLTIIALAHDVDSYLHSYLFAFCYWNGIGLGCLAVLMLHYLAGGRWSRLLQRPLEAGALTLPVMCVLFIPVLIALPHIYSWSRPEGMESPSVRQKAVYLNNGFFIARTILYFVVWSVLALLVRRQPSRADRGPEALSAPGLIVYVLTASFAAMDWTMSLEPEWYSSIYGMIFIIEQGLSALVVAIVTVIYLKIDNPSDATLSGKDLNDFGNMLLVFVILSAYVSFSQFIIIWSGNLPDEASWYLRRGRGGWQWVAAFVAICHFFAPFLILLFRRAKNNAASLTVVALLIAVAHVVEMYWFVMPAFNSEAIPHLSDFAALVLIGGVWLAVFVQALKRTAPLQSMTPDHAVQTAPKEQAS